MSFYIRDAKLSDQQAINALSYELYYEHFKNRPDVFKDQKESFTEKLLEKVLDNDSDQVIVACDEDGTVVGYSYFSFNTDKEHSLCHERKTTKITEICTRNDYRRKGIGLMLHNEIIKRAKDHGYPILELDVWFFNHSAIKFYERLGFLDKNKKMEFLIED